MARLQVDFEMAANTEHLEVRQSMVNPREVLVMDPKQFDVLVVSATTAASALRFQRTLSVGVLAVDPLGMRFSAQVIFETPCSRAFHRTEAPGIAGPTSVRPF